MLQNNPLLAQLKQQIREQLPQKEGTIRASERGFGFLEAENQERFFIPPPYMKKVMHGDKVTAVIRTENEREIAEPEALIQPFLQRFIGRVRRIKGRIRIEPDHPLIKDAYNAKLAEGIKADTLNDGDWVVAHLSEHALAKKHFNVTVTQRITDAGDPFAPWRVILARHDLAHEDLPLADTQEHSAPERVDLTHLPFITIDSASTQDMDDALYIEKSEQGWWLTVAIADPTAYISAESELEKAAKERGFTLYLPNNNVPMIPRNLSDDLCSLWADKKRPAVCARMWIAKEGELDTDKTEFSLAWIQSVGKLSYTDVSNWLENQESTVMESTQPMLKTLAEFATCRLAWRQTHQVVFTDKPDFSFAVDEKGQVTALHCEKRRIANRIVEESMIAANICGGHFLADKIGRGIFNTHEGLDPENIETAQKLLAEHLPEFAAQNLSEQNVFSALQRSLQQPENVWLNYRLRKMQTYATLSTTAKPHSSMGLTCYATWTSPIRKYSDMINHRLIKGYLTQETQTVMELNDDLLNHLTNCRRMHRAAEREINDWLYQDYLKPFVENKTVFQAEVTDVTRGGLRVRIEENGASAFLPLKSLKLDKKRIKAQSDEGILYIDNTCFARLGNMIPVVIAQLNAETRNVTVNYQGEALGA